MIRTAAFSAAQPSTTRTSQQATATATAPGAWRRAAAAVALGLAAAVTAPAAMAWNAQPAMVQFANTNGLMLSAQLFMPTTAAPAAGRGAVVMLHGCSGIYFTNSDGSITIGSQFREWADRITAAGYVALLVDSFTPRSAGNQCNNGAGVGVSEIFDRPADAMAARQFLAGTAVLQVNAARIGLLGWSHGASTILSTLATTQPVQHTQASPMAAGQPFRVGVAFYPGAGLSDAQCTQYKADTTTVLTTSCWKGISTSVWDSYAPLAIHHGDADATTKPEFVTTRVKRAQDSAGGASVSLTMYTGAHHSFDEPTVGGGTCTTSAATPDACAKTAGDAAAMATLSAWLN